MRLGLVGVVLLPACVVGEVPLDNRPCPCSQAYVCDEARNLCVRRTGDGGLPDLGFADAAALDATPAGVDASVNADASPGDATAADAPAPDAPAPDALPQQDALPGDAEPVDTGPPDTGPPDTGPPDTGVPDAGAPDAAPQGTVPLGGDCTVHEECTTGLCLELTTAPLSVCSRPCGSTSDCPLDFTCQFEGWMSFCIPERGYVPQASFDLVSGSTCAPAANTCQSGTCFAQSNTCIERCSSEADCAAFGGNCWNNRFAGNVNLCAPMPGLGGTGAACVAHDDCASGLCLFATGQCVPHCCSNADCPATDYCAEYGHSGGGPVKICRPKPTPSAEQPLGSQCMTALDCESRVCNFGTNQPVPPRRCTTYCCEDSDCAVLPGGGRCWPVAASFGSALIGICVAP